MHDGGADLGLDVVADAGEPSLLEPLSPERMADDEDRDAIDQCDPGVQGRLRVGFDRPLGADGQVVDEDLGAAVAPARL
jgi:hypothetical protein